MNALFCFHSFLAYVLVALRRLRLSLLRLLLWWVFFKRFCWFLILFCWSNRFLKWSLPRLHCLFYFSLRNLLCLLDYFFLFWLSFYLFRLFSILFIIYWRYNLFIWAMRLLWLLFYFDLLGTFFLVAKLHLFFFLLYH